MVADRVHALMGVAPRPVRERMAEVQLAARPGQIVWQLYTEFAKCVLEYDPEWLFLSLAPSKDRPADLPSWVPNLDSEPPLASNLTHPAWGFAALHYISIRSLYVEQRREATTDRPVSPQIRSPLSAAPSP